MFPLHAHRRLHSAVLVQAIGLVVAFACMGLCILTVRTEYAFDTFIPDIDRAYRVNMVIHPPDSSPITLPSISPAIAGALAQAPEVSRVTRLARERMVFRHGNDVTEEVTQVVDPGFLSAFGLRLTPASQKDPLQTPGAIVLGPAAASRYFGAGDPIGKTIAGADGTLWKVTGVLADTPANTHLELNILVSSASGSTALHRQSLRSGAGDPIAYTYVWFAPTADARAAKGLAARVLAARALADRLVAQVSATIPLMQADQAAVVRPTLSLVPVRDIHLNPLPAGELRPGGSRATVLMLAGIGLAILLASSINFALFALRQIESRRPELAIRRAFGASRPGLVFREFRQNIAICLATAALSAIVIALSAPILESWTGQPVNLDASGLLWLAAPPVVVALAASMTTILPAGSALRRSPGELFAPPVSWRAAAWQVGPIVCQYALAITVACLAIVMHLQTSFAISQSLHVDGARIWLVDAGVDGLRDGQLRTARDQISRLPGVRLASASSIAPTSVDSALVALRNPATGQSAPGSFPVNTVDSTFFGVYALPVVAGRGFSDAARGDSQVIMVSSAALPRLGFASPGQAVGSTVELMSPGGPVPTQIIGVVPDLTVRSVEQPVEPMVYAPQGHGGRYLSVELGNAHDVATVQEIGKLWRVTTGQHVMNGGFLDDRLASLYRPLNRLNDILLVLCVMSLILAGTGSYALALVMAVQKRREIALRRALGASRLQAAAWISLAFMAPVAGGLVLGLPIAAAVTMHWLSGYPVRFPLTPAPYVVASCAVLAIALFTILAQAIAVARRPPMDALREQAS